MPKMPQDSRGLSETSVAVSIPYFAIGGSFSVHDGISDDLAPNGHGAAPPFRKQCRSTAGLPFALL
jgi:hypothetical protein